MRGRAWLSVCTNCELEMNSEVSRFVSRKLEEGGQAALCMEWLRFEREEGRWAGVRSRCVGTAPYCAVFVVSTRLRSGGPSAVLEAAVGGVLRQGPCSPCMPEPPPPWLPSPVLC